jgi:hypothetical protein
MTRDVATEALIDAAYDAVCYLGKIVRGDETLGMTSEVTETRINVATTLIALANLGAEFRPDDDLIVVELEPAETD